MFLRAVEIRFALLYRISIKPPCLRVSARSVLTGRRLRAQCRTYLKMLGLRVGLVINFGRPTVREGIDRVVNETREEYRQRLARECPAALRNVIREEDCHDEASIPALAKGYGA